MLKKIVLLAAVLVPALASADPYESNNAYVIAGGASGHQDLKYIEGFYGPNHTKDDSFGRALIGVGADINQNLGVEVLYMTETDTTVQDSRQKDTIKTSGFQFALIGKAPLSPQFNLFGKLSANYMTVEDEFTDYLNPVNSGSVNDSTLQLGYGGGANFQITDQVGLRLAAERIQIRNAINGRGNFDFNQASLALTFAF